MSLLGLGWRFTNYLNILMAFLLAYTWFLFLKKAIVIANCHNKIISVKLIIYTFLPKIQNCTTTKTGKENILLLSFGSILNGSRNSWLEMNTWTCKVWKSPELSRPWTIKVYLSLNLCKNYIPVNFSK